MIPTLHIDRLTLRPYQRSDFDAYAAFMAGNRAVHMDGPLNKESFMTDTATRAAEILKDHRDSIDRLDAILVYTLGERFKHTQAVGRLKAEHNLPPSDPAREAAQIARLTDLAKRADLDPEFAKKFLNFVIQEVIQHHQQHQS